MISEPLGGTWSCCSLLGSAYGPANRTMCVDDGGDGFWFGINFLSLLSMSGNVHFSGNKHVIMLLPDQHNVHETFSIMAVLKVDK